MENTSSNGIVALIYPPILLRQNGLLLVMQHLKQHPNLSFQRTAYASR